MFLFLEVIIIFFNIFIPLISAQVNHTRSISTRACACYNQGVCDPLTGLCVFPSGYVGQQCERSEPTTLCNNVMCKNAGVCNIVSATESSCWCLLGFHGEYCERQRAASRCTQIQCRNGGVCYEHSPALSVFAYCACRPGFTGLFCETEYFRCPYAGTFSDPRNCAQGAYFLCDYSNQLIRAQCPKGLRFNINKMSCDHANAVTCPNI